jgi:hypothetical protein
MGIGIIMGTIVLITIRTITITAISESTPACTAAAIDPGDGEVGGNCRLPGREAEADWGPLKAFGCAAKNSNRTQAGSCRVYRKQ